MVPEAEARSVLCQPTEHLMHQREHFCVWWTFGVYRIAQCSTRNGQLIMCCVHRLDVVVHAIWVCFKLC